MTDYNNHNGIGKLVAEGVSACRAAIQAGELSATALCETCIDLIANRNGDINAFMQVDAEHALAAARAFDESGHQDKLVLGGIPIALKDNIDVAGLPTTAGIRAYENDVATDDAPLVSRLRQAGAVILGKTTLHEGALGATNDNAFSGRTHNPARHDYTPGGSSGGSAAAVAAGMVPLAIGTDTLGSVRVPSAYCGIAGIKPTHGLISNKGVVPLDTTLDSAGPMAPTIDDLELALGAFDDGAANTPRQTDQTRPVTLGVPVDLDDFDIEATVREGFDAVTESARLNKIYFAPFRLADFDLPRIRRAGFVLAQRGAIDYHRARLDQQPGQFSEVFHRAREFVDERLDTTRLEEARSLIESTRAQLLDLLGQCGAFVLPTTPQCAFAFDSVPPANQADFTALANICGGPSLSFPVPATDLPVGAQITSLPGSDRKLLALGRTLEQRLK